MEFVMQSQFFRCCALLSLTVMATSQLQLISVGNAQPPTPQGPSRSATQTPPAVPAPTSDLTDGLLDLLNEPAKKTPDASPNRGQRPAVPSSEFTPGDVGLDGEDLGENSANPLESVRQSMLIAAGMLQRGTTDASTQELQSGIVQRLDELINQLEQNRSQPNRSSSKQERSEPQPSNEQEQSPQSRQRQSEREQGPSESPELAESRPNSQIPGQSGTANTVEVDLADPRALQQNVWGHLPERMRTQMQSRMVEQFLPSYREQIEAYFKALLEPQ